MQSSQLNNINIYSHVCLTAFDHLVHRCFGTKAHFNLRPPKRSNEFNPDWWHQAGSKIYHAIKPLQLWLWLCWIPAKYDVSGPFVPYIGRSTQWISVCLKGNCSPSPTCDFIWDSSFVAWDVRNPNPKISRSYELYRRIYSTSKISNMVL